MPFSADKTRGDPAEQIFVELCRLYGLEAHISKATTYQELCEYDVVVEKIPVEVKSDWESYHTGNLCIEKNALLHSKSQYFAYCLPAVNGITFHIFTLEEICGLYKDYPKKIVGDGRDNLATTPSKSIMQTTGQPFYKWVQTIKELQRV